MEEWNGKTLSEEIIKHIHKSVVSYDKDSVCVESEKIYEVLKFLKETSGFSFDFSIAFCFSPISLIYFLSFLSGNPATAIKAKKPNSW